MTRHTVSASHGSRPDSSGRGGLMIPDVAGLSRISPSAFASSNAPRRIR